MANENHQEVFVERIANVAHANGVFRITLGVNEDANNVRPCVRLIIPGNQLGGILQGIANAARNIGEQVQANLGDGDQNVEAPAQAQKAKTTASRARGASAKKAASTKPAAKGKGARTKKKK
tara:strand:+ start:1179 stop:1544 length:366 start_codon:yes stop_codon:yes gene_type:complete